MFFLADDWSWAIALQVLGIALLLAGLGLFLVTNGQKLNITVSATLLSGLGLVIILIGMSFDGYALLSVG